jgi:hypothetical protein
MWEICKTCPVGDLDVILARVALVEMKAIKGASQVVRHTRVHVPVGLDGVAAALNVGGVCSVLAVLADLLLWLIGVIEAVAAAKSVVAVLVADLAGQLRAPAVATTTVATAAALTMAAAVALSAALSTLLRWLLRTAVATPTTMATSVIAGHGVGGGVDLPSCSVLLDAELGAEEEGIEAVEADHVIA